MPVYAVAFGPVKARRYLADNETEGSHAKGWRPYVWTKDIQRAELFDCPERAAAFAKDATGHEDWQVVIAPHRSVPTDDLGGTPAAMPLAA